MKYIAVYCGSSKGNKPIYSIDAWNFSKKLVEHDYSIVYGGGNIGLMGIIADAALQAGGKVIGVIPQKLVDYEVAHTNLTNLHIVETMHQRKALMCEYASGFAILPGAVGTLEELFEIVVLNQLNYMSKPIAFLNTNGFYSKLFDFLKYEAYEGFLKIETFNSLFITNSIDEICDYFNKSIK